MISTAIALVTGGALRDDTKNGCVADYYSFGLFRSGFSIPVIALLVYKALRLQALLNTLTKMYTAQCLFAADNGMETSST